MTAPTMMTSMNDLLERPVLVFGLGVAGRAAAVALARRGHELVMADDRPGPEARRLADELGLHIVVRPDPSELMATVGSVLPSPGLADSHPVFGAARRAAVEVISEFDLAEAWDRRPFAAITGTNGKTTVTTLVCDVLNASGQRAVDAGNTDVPLVEAIDDPSVDVFVVEASSFRLGHSRHVAPDVGCWLNFAPDHLDVHASLQSYETAKSRVWSQQTPDQIAVANADDPIVMSHASGPGRVVTFGLGAASIEPDYCQVGSGLRRPDGETIIDVGELFRALPHDRSNALAAVATADPLGASAVGAASALAAFRGLRHRVELVGVRDGVEWYDDSKATAPHATAAAVSGFASVVLIAGGRNKGLDLSALATLDNVVAAVGIGDSAEEIAEAFAGRPHAVAGSMSDAVEAAARLAHTGDVVLLSPGCASFDWYANYAERGDDFVRCVTAQVLSTGSRP